MVLGLALLFDEEGGVGAETLDERPRAAVGGSPGDGTEGVCLGAVVALVDEHDIVILEPRKISCRSFMGELLPELRT
jgi:hypothetical protein